LTSHQAKHVEIDKLYQVINVEPYSPGPVAVAE